MKRKLKHENIKEHSTGSARTTMSAEDLFTVLQETRVIPHNLIHLAGELVINAELYKNHNDPGWEALCKEVEDTYPELGRWAATENGYEVCREYIGGCIEEHICYNGIPARHVLIQLPSGQLKLRKFANIDVAQLTQYLIKIFSTCTTTLRWKIPYGKKFLNSYGLSTDAPECQLQQSLMYVTVKGTFDVAYGQPIETHEKTVLIGSIEHIPKISQDILKWIRGVSNKGASRRVLNRSSRV
jgi:hypothetical protein